MKYVWVLEWYPDSELMLVFSQQKLAIQYARNHYDGKKLVWQRKRKWLVDPTAKDDGYDGICYRVIKCKVVRQLS